MGKFKVVQWVIVYYPSNACPIGGSIDEVQYCTVQRKYQGMQHNEAQIKRIVRGGKDENVMSRMRSGHTGINSTLFMAEKYDTGNCDQCGLKR